MHKLLLLLVVGSTSAFLPNDCPKSGHWLLPHEKFCNRYYQCNHGSKVLRSCGPGTQFDVQLQICNWPHRVDCILGIRPEVATPNNKYQSTTINSLPAHSIESRGSTRSYHSFDRLPNGCPADFSIHHLLPHETDCSKFYTCSNGNKFNMNCAPGTLFDYRNQICNWPDSVECVTFPETTTTASSTSVSTTTANPTTATHIESTTSNFSTTLPSSTFTTESEEIVVTTTAATTEDLVENTTVTEFDKVTTDVYITTSSAPQSTYTILPENTPAHIPTTTTSSPLTSTSTPIDSIESTTTELSVITTESDEINTTTTTQTSTTDNSIQNTTVTEIDNVTTGVYNNITSIAPQSTQTTFEDNTTTYIPITTSTILSTTTASSTSSSEIPTTLDSEESTYSTPLASTMSTKSDESDATTEATQTPTTEVLFENTTVIEMTSSTAQSTNTTFPDTNIPITSTTPSTTTVSFTSTSMIPTTSSTLETTTIASATVLPTIITTESHENDTTTQATQITTTENLLEETTIAEITSSTPESTSTTLLDNTVNIPVTITTTTIDSSISTSDISTASVSEESTSATTPTSIITTESDEIDSTQSPTTESLLDDTTVAEITSGAPESTSTIPPVETTTVNVPITITTTPATTTVSSTSTSDIPTTSVSEKSTTPSSITTESDEIVSTTQATLTSTTEDLIEDTTVSEITPGASESTSTTLVEATTANVPITTTTTSVTTIVSSIPTSEIPTTPGFEESTSTATPSSIVSTESDENAATTQATQSPTTENLLEETTVDTPSALQSTTTSFSETTISNNPITTTTITTTTTPTTTGSIEFTTINSTATFLPTVTIEPSTENYEITTFTVTTNLQESTSNSNIDAESTTKSWFDTTTSEHIDDTTTSAETTTTDVVDHTTGTPNSPTPPSCPPGTFGNFPHPERCDAYYMCAGGVAILLNCAEGFEYDVVQRVCVPIAPGRCTLGSATTVPSEVITTPSVTTTEPITDAPRTTVETEITTTDVIDHTTETPNGPTLPGCPPGTFGNFPHPERCDAYFMCAGGVAIPLNCAEGFEYDIVQRVCVPITPGGCTLGSATTIPSEVITTPSVTTTEPITDAPRTTVDTEVITTDVVDHTTGTPNGPTLPSCPPGTFGNFPHPERCDAYFMCAGGVAIPLNCAEGFEYNIVQRVCVPIAPGGCTLGSATTVPSEIFTTPSITTTEPLTDEPRTTVDTEVTTTDVVDHTTGTPSGPSLPGCPPGTFGNFPHPERCDAYFMCAGGVAIPLNCAEGFEYNIVQRVCMPIAPGGCTLGSATTVPSEVTTTPSITTTDVVDETTETPNGTKLPDCPPGTFGNFPHPERCDAYYMCAGGVAIPLNCAEGFEYDIVQRVCSPIGSGGCTLGSATTVPSEVITTPSVTTTEPSTDAPDAPKLPDCPPGTFGNFPHLERCDAYYMCAGGVAISLNCAEGFEYDLVQRVCVPVAPGGCTLGLATTTSSDIFSSIEPSTDAPSEEDSAEARTESDQSIDSGDLKDITSAPLPDCPVGIFGNFPSLDRCDAYYMCAGGMAISLVCAEGFEFDLVQKICVPISPGGCTLNVATTSPAEAFTTENIVYDPITSPKLECPVGAFGNFPLPDRCDAFYMCAGGMAIPLNCAEGYEFDIIKKTCVPISSEGCTFANSGATADKGSDNSYSAVQTDLQRSKRQTHSENDVARIIPVCKKVIDGMVPHTELCDSFYMCQNGEATQLRCSQGYEFEPSTKTCELISEIGCTSRTTLNL